MLIVLIQLLTNPLVCNPMTLWSIKISAIEQKYVLILFPVLLLSSRVHISVRGAAILATLDVPRYLEKVY